ncbi:MAG: hypothetical protein OXD29_06595 [Roseovarius sp.]|nr:hypothetical protein [Roseovarius sp.]MCY4207604.1 hypothetical protein [Roseovarius sp.]MCY4293223.1 hypothetical protein [Roseovarius sp.]MCY4315182.1 hypothetical protein [Roseovarius sp.]
MNMKLAITLMLTALLGLAACEAPEEVMEEEMMVEEESTMTKL